MVDLVGLMLKLHKDLPKARTAPEKTGLVRGSWFSVLGRNRTLDHEARTMD